MNDESFSALESRVGDSVVTVEEFAVTAGKVAEFSRAITDPNPVFLDESAAGERGHDRMPAPPTFTRVSTFTRYRPPNTPEYGIELGFDPERLLHGEQSYEYERPVRVGDVLSGTSTLTDVYRRDGRRGGTMTFAELETSFTDQHGEHVLTECSTTIETAPVDDTTHTDDDTVQASRGGSATSVSGLSPRSIQPRRTPPTERLDSTDSLAVGDRGPTITVESLTRQDFVRYAGASGDFNPIHYNEPYATAAGIPSVFGQGMLTAGITGRVLTDWVGIDAIDSFGVRFQSRVFPGDTVVASGNVTEVSDDITIELTAETETETVLSGRATVSDVA
ncbi:FAS1-like dehydratase domain-containing protein [Halocatena halophila]|uniref:FAS1-like dehydratase domain-containing protein n=1 Tax=Halocatena halophila TaxID=2814576 RepID=UPI0038B31128